MSQVKTNQSRQQFTPGSGKTKQMSELEVLIRARYPVIYVVSWEEQRVLGQICRIASRLGKGVFEWSVNTGLVPAGTLLQSQRAGDTPTQDPLIAFGDVIKHLQPALYVFKDFHPFLKGHNISVVRKLKEVAVLLKKTYKTIVIVSPMFQIPAELEKDVTVVDFGLPTEDDFELLLGEIIEQVKENPKINVNVDAKMREQVVHALLGLTLSEAENVLAKTLVLYRGLGGESLGVINSEKKQIIRKSGLLEYYDAQEQIESVGGLDALKSWLVRRSVVFSDKARDFGLPAPKGVLLLGVQGCGKSLMAKTISSIWRLPLLRFDVGRVFGSLVGSSEENVRRAIKVAESVCPVVFWVDEIDKAFYALRAGGGSDGGTSSRVFSTFITWLSEKREPVFVVATANNISLLPPELLRKGRFDEIFFVDLPSFAERREIFRVHLSKRRMDPDEFDLDALAESSVGHSGAEIEQALIDAMFDVFYEGQALTAKKVIESLSNTVPLSKTMGEDIDKLRKWADGRARPATSEQVTVGPGSNKRKLEI